VTQRENFVSLLKRRGYEAMPVTLSLCPVLRDKFEAYLREHPMEVNYSYANLRGLDWEIASPEQFLREYYPDKRFKEGTTVSGWGVVNEPGSAAAFHMMRFYHPMESFHSVEQIEAYPFPRFLTEDLARMKREAEALHAKGLAVVGDMQCTVWETAWSMRGMENLLCDMMEDSPMATVLLDKVTERAVMRAKAFTEAGVDAVYLGDDVGMQRTLLMSEELYCEWLKPRLMKVISAIREANPDTIVIYHSCGYVKELIPHLIEAGIDVLNPVQPECMDFREIHDMYGDRISFSGTIGTQSVMPFGTPEDVRRTVFENLDIAGEKGGLLVCPTHMLEPEVPLENLLAYIRACEEYTK